MTPDDVDDLRQLADLYRQTSPPEPSEAAWAEVFARVPSPAPRAPRGAGWWGPIVGAAALAAVASLALLVRAPAGPLAAADDEGPWEVALASEVQILRSGTDDADRLALGPRPQMGEFAVATAEEIVVVKAEDNPDGETTPTLDTGGPLSVIDWAGGRGDPPPRPTP